MTFRASAYTWRNKDGTETPGATIGTRNRGTAFIPAKALRKIADQLHDIADQYEYDEQEQH